MTDATDEYPEFVLSAHARHCGTAELAESGIDLSQLRRNLRLTPEERIDRMVQAARFFAELRGALRPSR